MWAILILAAISATSGQHPHLSGSEQCNKPVPGLYTQTRGVDVTVLDMKPIDPVADAGYRGVVIRLTCLNGTKRTIEGIQYDQPDQIWVIQEIPSGQLVSSAQVMTRTSEARDALSVNAGLSGTIKQFSFSSSTSFSKMEKTLHQKERKTQYVSATFSGREAELLPAQYLTLGSEAQQAVNILPPDYVNHPQEFRNFIKEYGTHYMTSATYGGLMQTYQETKTEYYETHTEMEIASQASAGFDALLVAKGGTSTSHTEIDSTFTSSTSVNIRYYGGSANLMADKGLAEWQPTISANPWAMSSSLKPISALIKDASKSKQMDIAVQDYVLYTYLDKELPRILKLLPEKVQAKPEVAELLGRINAMKTNVIPLVPDDVEDIGLETEEMYMRLYAEFYNAEDGLKSVNSYDGPMDFMCPAGRIITHIKSNHDNYYEDRKWQLGCTLVPGLGDLLNCAWSDYANGFDGGMDYVCPGDGVIKGWYSYHDNYYEDRRFKFMCCRVNGAGQKDCRQTDYVNSFDGGFELQLKRGSEVLTGASSYHDSYYEDRRWKYTICNLEYYNLPARDAPKSLSELGLNITSEVSVNGPNA